MEKHVYTQAELVAIGQRVVDYFDDVGECLLCDVEEDRGDGGPPVHEAHCSIKNPTGLPAEPASKPRTTAGR